MTIKSSFSPIESLGRQIRQKPVVILEHFINCVLIFASLEESFYCATATVWTTDISGTAAPLCTTGCDTESDSGSIITSTPASASASTSSAQLSSTSTGGVPAATARIAMSLAGTMALLSLAIAL